MADLAGRRIYSADLAPIADSRFTLEVNGDDRFAYIYFVEPLARHARHLPEIWPYVVDDDGYLTKEAARGVTQRLHKLLPPNDGVEHIEGLETSEEPAVGLSIHSMYRRDETFGFWFDRIGRRLITTIVNLTNPHAAPYLFGVLDNR
ncbi:hypothetical protein [Mycobacterium sp. NPDC050853]|uniref:hypothetical protein n=1 Tax=Mycobacterium sp. NPDC050853 TaxID=3155160 RepID=UPI00340CAE9E